MSGSKTRDGPHFNDGGDVRRMPAGVRAQDSGAEADDEC